MTPIQKESKSALPFNSPTTSVYEISLNDISLGTNGFAEEIGRGKFGKSFKGTLFGIPVVVKQFSSGIFNSNEEFKTHFSTLSQFHHPNIVSVLGVTVSGIGRYVSYEYVFNKTLQQAIEAYPSSFDLIKQKGVILSTCSALSYMQKVSSKSPIYHLNLKPTNILLDELYRPKITDFEVPGCVVSKKNPSSVPNIFICPEYCSKGVSSSTSDVYSVGAIIIAMVCGKANYDANLFDALESEERSSNYHISYRTNGNTKIANALIELALDCTGEPAHRLTLETVIQELKKE